MGPRSESVALHNDAVARARADDLESACRYLKRAIRIDGAEAVDVRTLKFLWQAARDTADWQTALAAGFKAGARDPLDFEFVNRVIRSLRDCPDGALAQVQSPPCRESRPTLSVVVVSQDDQRYAAVDAEFDAAFCEWPHERIRIKGANSMYDGYARGAARASGEVLVFAHDDIRFARVDFADRLANALVGSDLVGVAGTTRVTGPALLWSGHPWLRGAITHHAPTDSSFEFAITSLAGPRTTDAQAVDGVFIAARRGLVDEIGFDPEGIPGFHFYDLDFSYRAFRAGARVTIAADLALIHASRGAFGESFARASNVFAAKFPELVEPPGSHRHWYALALPNRVAVASMYEKLFAAWQLDFRQGADSVDIKRA